MTNRLVEEGILFAGGGGGFFFAAMLDAMLELDCLRSARPKYSPCGVGECPLAGVKYGVLGELRLDPPFAHGDPGVVRPSYGVGGIEDGVN